MATNLAIGARPCFLRGFGPLPLARIARSTDVASSTAAHGAESLYVRRRIFHNGSRFITNHLDQKCSATPVLLGVQRLCTSPFRQTLPTLSPNSRRQVSRLPAQKDKHAQNRDDQSSEQDHGQESPSEKSSQKATVSTQQDTAKPIIDRSLEAAREQTKVVTDKVRASLTNLTPHENIYNLPNFLTVTRLIAAPTTAYLLLHDHHHWALALFAYAGITDLIDGWLARKWKLQTVAGSVIDPMADKTLMIILTVTLAVKGALPAYLATLILGRDASLALAAIYYRYASLPAPKTFLRYWDFSLPSAEVHPTAVSKYNTFLQLILIGSTIALPVVLSSAAASAAAAADPASSSSSSIWTTLSTAENQVLLKQIMTYFQYVVAATTVWSGMSYAFLKDAVTIMGKDEALKAKQGARGRQVIGVTFGAVVLLAAWFALNVDEKQVDGIRQSASEGDEEERRDVPKKSAK